MKKEEKLKQIKATERDTREGQSAIFEDLERDRLEEIILDLKNLAALARVCGAGFDTPESLADVSAMDICNSFMGISKQLQGISEEVSSILNDYHIA